MCLRSISSGISWALLVSATQHNTTQHNYNSEFETKKMPRANRSKRTLANEGSHSVGTEIPQTSSSPMQSWESTEEYLRRKGEIERITIERTGLVPKPAQVRLALALDMGKDVSCIAATGYGKSLAFMMAVFMMQRRMLSRRSKQFAICITPIEALGDDQVEKARRWGINAVSLSEKEVHQNAGILKAIARGEYELGTMATIPPD